MNTNNCLLATDSHNTSSEITHLSNHLHPLNNSFNYNTCSVFHSTNATADNRDPHHTPGGPATLTSQSSQSVSRPSTTILRPRMPFKVAAFNVRTLQPFDQQVALARTMESLSIDVCCVSETRIQDPSVVLQLKSPTSPPFHLRLSGDAVASASGLAGVGVALSNRAEAALLDWIPVNSRLCAIRIEGSCRVSSKRPDKRNLFIVSAYAPTDCSSAAIKDEFYYQLHDLLLKARRTDVVMLAGDMNAQVGLLSSDEVRLGGPHGLNKPRTDNGGRLLDICAAHQLFLVSTNFRHSVRRSATWRPPNPNQSWTQIDHIAISYRWRGSVQNCRSYWSTCLDSDHALVCSNVVFRYGGQP